MSEASDPERLIVTISVAELRDIVSTEVKRALAVEGDDLPELVTTKEMARQIGVSSSTLRAYVQQGCPHVQAGKGYRFRPANVFHWLGNRGA